MSEPLERTTAILERIMRFFVSAERTIFVGTRVRILLLVLMLVSPGVAFSVDYHVDGVSGADGVGCGSPVAPCGTIQYAVNLASSGDVVKVTEGSYFYQGSGVDPCANNGIDDPAVLCVLNKVITVSGGFTSADWNSRMVGAVTVIDAQNQSRAVLVMHTSEQAPACGLTLEGLTVRNGKVVGESSGDFNAISAYGAGMLADNSTVVLRGVAFEYNDVIGGTTTQQYGGDAAGGGAMFRGDRGSTTFEYVRFSDNTSSGGDGADRGGYALGGGFATCCGASAIGSHIVVENNTARGGNTAGAGDVGGVRADGLGGGIAFGVADFGDGTGGSSADLSDLEVVGNLAQGGAGAQFGAFAFGGGVFAEGKTADSTSITLRQVRIMENAAQGGSSLNGGPAFGGGLATAESSITLEDSKIINNRSTGGSGGVSEGADRGSGMGGGVHFQKLSSAQIVAAVRNTVVANNRAEVGATGDEFLGGGGGGMSVQGEFNLLLEHVTFAENSLNSADMFGHAIVLISWPSAPTVDLDYALVADHDDPTGPQGPSALHAQVGAVFNLDSGIFAGNFDDHNNGGYQAGTFNGLGSFLNFSSAGFFDPGAPEYDYHLLPDSEAISRGAGSSVSDDFEGQGRDALPDLGADEQGLPAVLFLDGFESSGAWAWSGNV